jgi:hypothetical protein
VIFGVAVCNAVLFHLYPKALECVATGEEKLGSCCIDGSIKRGACM